MFPKTSVGLVNLLEMMLQFNPLCRPSAKQCMMLPIFDFIRPAEEPKPDFKIKLNEDIKSEMKIDYDSWFQSGKYGPSNEIDAFKQQVLDQIYELRQ